MIKYRIEEVNNQYSIKEIQTDLHIKSYKSLKRANILVRNLNKGTGFDGQTPNFVLNKFVVNK